MPLEGRMDVEIGKRRFDVDEYYRMAEAGILSPDDRVELIEGEIVTMSPIGSRHAAGVDRTARAFFSRVAPEAGIVRVQAPVRLSHRTEPQPDISILRPRADFYAEAHPGPGDILLVVEVGDSSLEYDRHIKTRVYADAGIPEYWLVDIDGRRLTRFRDPQQGRYRDTTEHEAGETLAPGALQNCVINVGDLVR